MYRCAGIGRQVPFRPEWFKNCTSSSLVIYIFIAACGSQPPPLLRKGGGEVKNLSKLFYNMRKMTIEMNYFVVHLGGQGGYIINRNRV